MSKLLPFCLNYSLLVITLANIGLSAEVRDLEVLTRNNQLWVCNYEQIDAKNPEMKWRESTELGAFTSEEKGMIFYGQPVQKMMLTVNSENQLAQSLFMVVVDEEMSKGMDDDAFKKQALKWRDLVNKKLKEKSKRMPNIQVGNDDYTRVAWDDGKSTIVLAMISSDHAKRIELIYHERSHGLARLRLEGKQEVTRATKIFDGGVTDIEEESAPPKKLTNNTISRSSTRDLQKLFKVAENFDADWPKLVKSDSPDITIIKESEEEETFIYHSPNYEFVCDVKISKNVIKNFATLFESTRLYCQEMPLAMVRAQMPEGKVKFRILLFGTKASYFKNGGPQGSAGVYMSGEGVIMVPLESLGVKKVGSSFMFDYKVSNKTLPHEITHQLTNIEYFSEGARGWFSEGLAEYVAATAYRSGKFMVNGNLNDIRSFVTEGSRKDGRGRYLGDEISAPDIKQYMLMSYRDFTANGNFNYGLGALVTYYFLHMENDGDRKNINAFLSALNDGKKGEEALNVLLAGRSFDDLEVEITKAWRTRGVKINFK
ncbi:MAG: hypothetical protein ACI9SQ_000804 [Rubritalea sp.]|jgi:hypothetical protein